METTKEFDEAVSYIAAKLKDKTVENSDATPLYILLVATELNMLNQNIDKLINTIDFR